jgi:hypothetical protein
MTVEVRVNLKVATWLDLMQPPPTKYGSEITPSIPVSVSRNCIMGRLFGIVIRPFGPGKMWSESSGRPITFRLISSPPPSLYSSASPVVSLSIHLEDAVAEPVQCQAGRVPDSVHEVCGQRSRENKWRQAIGFYFARKSVLIKPRLLPKPCRQHLNQALPTFIASAPVA